MTNYWWQSELWRQQIPLSIFTLSLAFFAPPENSLVGYDSLMKNFPFRMHEKSSFSSHFMIILANEKFFIFFWIFPYGAWPNSLGCFPTHKQSIIQFKLLHGSDLIERTLKLCRLPLCLIFMVQNWKVFACIASRGLSRRSRHEM